MNRLEKHRCLRCGKEHIWETNDLNADIFINQWHPIDLGVMGVGSGLEGCSVKGEICDECLCNYVEQSVHNNEIYKTNLNLYEEMIR